MPEYPEVATLINYLNHQNFFNKKIVKIKIIDDFILKNCNKSSFINFVINEAIINLKQIGKYIIFSLTNKKVLLIHLRLEGKIFYLDEKENICKFPMLEIYFSHHKKIVYDDSRKFGTFNIYKNINELLLAKEIIKLGKQPFDKSLTPNYLCSCLKNKNQKIKSILLDQRIIAGIGNIYADEILFASKISPLRKGKDITIDECKQIINQCQKIMTNSIKHNGTTVFTFKFNWNHSGSYQKYLKVYGRKNLPCLRCKNILKQIKMNGRGTVYCNNCQK